MALTFTITDGTTTLNLLTSDIRSRDGYMPQVATPPGDGSIPPYLTETIPVLLQGATHDGLATTLQTFHTLQKLAAEYHVTPQINAPVWFQCQTRNETNARRALVKSLSLDLSARLGGMYDQDCNLVQGIEGTIILVRHPYWEATTARTFPEYAAVFVEMISLYDYTAAGTGGVPAAHDIVGDVGARIGYMRLSPLAGEHLGRVWIGMRSASRHGTLANFVPLWECEDGTNGTDAADIVDATASGNDKVTVTPGTATWATRMTFELSDISGNDSDQYGDFLWLLRTQVSAGTWEVKLQFGYSEAAAADYVEHEAIEVTNTGWDIKSIAVQAIPIRDLDVFRTNVLSDAYDSSFTIKVLARRTDGAGTLDLDCLFLVPMDEGYLFTGAFDSLGSAPTSSSLWLGTAPDDHNGSITGATGGGASFGESPPLTSHNFTLPPGDGRMIVLHAQQTDSDDTEEIDINLGDDGAYYERWLSLRGAE